MGAPDWICDDLVIIGLHGIYEADVIKRPQDHLVDGDGGCESRRDEKAIPQVEREDIMVDLVIHGEFFVDLDRSAILGVSGSVGGKC